MKIPGLTKAVIQENTAGGSYERGEEYFERGAVRFVEQRNGEIEAAVKGSHYLPYAVHIQFDERGIQAVECTCPYHGGTWCKHIVATLLRCLEESSEDEEATSVAALLDGLDRETVVAIVQRLAARHPELTDSIKQELSRLDS